MDPAQPARPDRSRTRRGSCRRRTSPWRTAARGNGDRAAPRRRCPAAPERCPTSSPPPSCGGAAAGRRAARRAGARRRCWRRAWARCATGSATRSPGWLASRVVLEALSCVSYVAHVPARSSASSMSWRTSWEIGVVGARRRLDRAGERRRRARARRLDPAPRRHAGGADRPALGRVLPHQELGQLRRGRGDRHADGGRARRAAPLAAADRAAGGAVRRGDRRSCCRSRGSGPGDDPAPAPARLRARGRRGPQGARRRHRRGGRDPARARRAGDRRRDRLLGVRQRRAVGDLPRLRRRRPAHRRS